MAEFCICGFILSERDRMALGWDFMTVNEVVQ